MKHGRELDLLVAEKVMDYVSCDRVHTYWNQLPMGGCLYKLGENEEICGHIFKVNIPEYSTSIAAAWEVVEKMRSAGHRVKIYSEPNGCTWCIDFSDDGYDAEFYERGSFALVVCLAALKAVGVEE